MTTDKQRGCRILAAIVEGYDSRIFDPLSAPYRAGINTFAYR